MKTIKVTDNFNTQVLKCLYNTLTKIHILLHFLTSEKCQTACNSNVTYNTLTVVKYQTVNLQVKAKKSAASSFYENVCSHWLLAMFIYLRLHNQLSCNLMVHVTLTVMGAHLKNTALSVAKKALNLRHKFQYQNMKQSKAIPIFLSILSHKQQWYESENQTE